MQVDLAQLEALAGNLDSNANTAEGALVKSAETRIRELLSALAEVRQSKSHRGAVEAAQRGIAGDPQAKIWTQTELDAGVFGEDPRGEPFVEPVEDFFVGQKVRFQSFLKESHGEDVWAIVKRQSPRPFRPAEGSWGDYHEDFLRSEVDRQSRVFVLQKEGSATEIKAAHWELELVK